jgi:hypothetical protein
MKRLGAGKTPNKKRPKGARNATFRAEKLRRRQEAEARQAKTAALTPQQRLLALDRAFGVGQGAQRERARLEAMLAAATTVKPDLSKLPKSVKSKSEQKRLKALTGVEIPVVHAA